MHTVKPGDGWTGQPDLFLAGDISNCGDWQSGVQDITVADVVAHLGGLRSRYRGLP